MVVETTEISGDRPTCWSGRALDAVSMFHTSKRHRISSGPASATSADVDPVITPAAADRVVELLTTYGGGTKSAPAVTVVGAPPARPTSRSADLPARVTGIDIGAATTVGEPRAIGCRLEQRGGGAHGNPPP